MIQCYEDRVTIYQPLLISNFASKINETVISSNYEDQIEINEDMK